jgi:glycosyltransferase involved in cell wall biosynthesis
MAAGIVVVASDFPLWKSIIEKAQCGLCVDPLNPAAIAKAIDALLSQPELAFQMGQRGRQAVLAQYNWGVEEAKLLELVRHIESL